MQRVGLLRGQIPERGSVAVEHHLVASVVLYYLDIRDVDDGVGCQRVAARIVAVGVTVGADDELVVLAGHSPHLGRQRSGGREDVQAAAFVCLVDVALL